MTGTDGMRAARTAMLMAGVIALATGCCLTRTMPANTPTAAGINPAALADPATDDCGHLDNWADLYLLAEQIKKARKPPVLPPKKTILAISGGGMYGAFSAGVLCGWTEAGDRPNFDVVTGISTGALVAAYTFGGPRFDPEMKRAYTSVTNANIYERRRILQIVFSDSLADSTPLANLIEQGTRPEYFQAVIAEHAKGRRLYVGTTDIDGKRQVIWDMGAIATRNTPESVALFRQVLLASAAIPGFFPPVRIPVEVQGVKYEEQHVDGAITSAMFARLPWQPADRRDDLPGTAFYGSDMYVIVSGKLYSDAAPVGPRAFSVAGASVSSLIYTQTRGALFQLYASTILTGMNFRCAALRGDCEVTGASTEFDPVQMTRLFNEGRRQILGGTAWRETPPGAERGESPGVRSGGPLVVSPDLEPLPSPVPVVPPRGRILPVPANPVAK